MAITPLPLKERKVEVRKYSYHIAKFSNRVHERNLWTSGYVDPIYTTDNTYVNNLASLHTEYEVYDRVD